jgi:predicted solute-binding protein
MEVDLTYSFALHGFLATYAICSVRHDAQASQADRLIASETETISPILDASQRCVHETNIREITFQEPRSEIAFFSKSHLVHSVRRVLDGDGISIVHTLGKYIMPAFE